MEKGSKNNGELNLNDIKNGLKGDDAIYVACPPLAKDESMHQSVVFEVFNVIYNKNDWTPINNYFQCSKCEHVVYVVRGKGNAPMHRHKCMVAHKLAKSADAQTATDSSNVRESEKDCAACGEPKKIFQLEASLLACCFSDISRVADRYGPMSMTTIEKILPNGSSEEEW